jgi:molybdate transport system permease protein
MGLTSEESQALFLSARIALCATALCLPLGIAVSWAMARREFPGKCIADALIQLPMVLPPVPVFEEA